MPAGKPAYVWSGTEWIPIGLQIGAKYQPGQPSASASTTGDLWIDSTTNLPYVWTGTAWTILSASVNLSPYLTTASASSIYAPKISPALTGIPTAPTASVGTDSTQIATTAFVYDQAPLFSNRNLLYNGAMQVAQRSASVTGITGTGYNTADRWKLQLQSLGTWTQDIQNDAPIGSGFRKSFRVLCTTADASPAATDYGCIIQHLEGQDLQRIAKGTSSAQQLALSFWVKSNVVGTYSVMLYDVDNARFVSFNYSISASATWEKKSIIIPADTTGSFDNDNGDSLQLYFNLGTGSTYTGGSAQNTWSSGTAFGSQWMPSQINLASAINNYWQITGVQLEVGPFSTPFEFKSYSQELKECQRYYFKTTPGAVNSPFGVGWNINTTQAVIHTSFPVTMRVRPTILEQSGVANQYQIAHTTVATTCSAVPSLNVSAPDGASTFFTVASGLTAGQGSSGRTDATNGANAYLAWSAEL